MKDLKKGQSKIEKICAMLKEETLEPAQKEAHEIIGRAEKQAEHIIAAAEKAAEKLHLDARAAIEHEKNIFHASLSQASHQSLEALRQSIERTFFNEHLPSLIAKNTADPAVIAKLIQAIVAALEKEGLAADLTVLVPKTVTPRQVNELLLQDVVNTLREKSVVLSDFAGGVKIRLQDKQLTIDLSDEALKELLSGYVARKDFRKLLFGNV